MILIGYRACALSRWILNGRCIVNPYFEVASFHIAFIVNIHDDYDDIDFSLGVAVT